MTTPTSIIIDLALTQDEDGGLFDAINADLPSVIAQNNHDAIVESWNTRVINTRALDEPITRAMRAGWGDSNDEEIDALREALDVALGLLGYDDRPIEEAVEKWAEQKGLA